MKKKNVKRIYSKPRLEIVKIDNEITIFMMSNPPDPEGMNMNTPLDSNPFKIKNLG